MVADKKSDRIIVVGGGFAGVSAVAGLKRRATWLDPTSHFEFTPHIPEIISGTKSPKALRLSRRRIAKRLGHKFVQTAAVSIDPRAQTVATADGKTLEYDVLILAAGGEIQGAGIPGVREFGFPCQQVEHAAAIRDRARLLRRIKQPAHITVVGGGFTGVEVLGELLRGYRRSKHLSFRMIESGPRLMKGYDNFLSKRLLNHAKKAGVEFLFGTRVREVGEDHIVLDNGEQLPSQLTAWTVGKRASSILASTGLADEGAPIRVQSTLQTLAFANILVAGDASHFPGAAYKQALVALDMGAHAAKNARRILRGKLPRRYDGKREYNLILPFGDLSAFLLYPDGQIVESEAVSFLQEDLFQSTMSVVDDQTGADLSTVLRRMADRAEESVDRLPKLGTLLSSSVRVHQR